MVHTRTRWKKTAQTLSFTHTYEIKVGIMIIAKIIPQLHIKCALFIFPLAGPQLTIKINKWNEKLKSMGEQEKEQ